MQSEMGDRCITGCSDEINQLDHLYRGCQDISLTDDKAEQISSGPTPAGILFIHIGFRRYDAGRFIGQIYVCWLSE